MRGLLLRGLLRSCRGSGSTLGGVVVARLGLALALDSARDRGAQVVRRVAKRIDQVEGMRSDARDQPVDVGGDCLGALGRQPPVNEIPRQVLLNQTETEQVSQPGEHLPGTGIHRSIKCPGERFPLQ